MAKKILIVAPVVCYPATKGNSARIAGIYEHLLLMGFDISYLHLPDAFFDPAEMKHQFGDKYFYRQFHRLNFVKWRLAVKALKTIVLFKKYRKVNVDDFLEPAGITLYKNVIKKVKPDIVWINYSYYSHLFDHTPPGTLKILDAHDSIYLRFNNIFNDPTKYKNFKIDLADEIKCINRADKVVCIQQNEAAFFKENGCVKKICVLGHLHTFISTLVREDKNKLLFLANDYFIYEHAIKKFIEDIWPLLVIKRPGIHLFIAGKICEKLDQRALGENIDLLGVVKDLKALYDSIDVTINPVKTGSGLKIKVIESLCFGKPVVTTSLGKEGLDEFENKGLLIADHIEIWVDNIITLLSNKQYYNDQISGLESSIAQYNERNIVILEKIISTTGY